MFHTGNDENQKGLSIWVFVALFVVIATIGLAVVVMTGSPTRDSRSTRTNIGVVGETTTSTVPNTTIADGSVATSQSTPSTTAAVTNVTLPNGDPAPPGVSRVIQAGDVLSFGFEIDPSELGDKPMAVVPPMKTDAPSETSSVTVRVDCAKTSREQLAQVSVTETDSLITVSAVTLVPPNAFGCNPSTQPRIITMPLRQPVGTRTVTVLPTSTKLPAVDLGNPGN